MRAFGYYVDTPGWRVGEIAARNKNVHLCQNIMVYWDLFGPVTPSRKRECVYRYAELTKDPTACEVLMPSEYGIACISNIVTISYEHRPDTGFFPFSACENIPEEDVRWDWCAYVLAHRERSTAPCATIAHPAVQKACIMKFEAWEKYPQLRNSSYFGRAATSE